MGSVQSLNARLIVTEKFIRLSLVHIEEAYGFCRACASILSRHPTPKDLTRVGLLPAGENKGGSEDPEAVFQAHALWYTALGLHELRRTFEHNLVKVAPAVAALRTYIIGYAKGLREAGGNPPDDLEFVK